MKTSLPSPGRVPAVGSVRRPSPVLTATGEQLCSLGLGSPIVCAASIGIGEHLAMPPLPHHRAYGSVPRRFGGLSTLQFLHWRQSETTETGFGEAAVQGF